MRFRFSCVPWKPRWVPRLLPDGRRTIHLNSRAPVPAQRNPGCKKGVALMLAQRHGLGETGAFEKRIEPVWAQGLGSGEKPSRKIPAWERRREGRRAYLRERWRPSAHEQARLSQDGTMRQNEGNSLPREPDLSQAGTMLHPPGTTSRLGRSVARARKARSKEGPRGPRFRSTPSSQRRPELCRRSRASGTKRRPVKNLRVSALSTHSHRERSTAYQDCSCPSARAYPSTTAHLMKR